MFFESHKKIILTFIATLFILISSLAAAGTPGTLKWAFKTGHWIGSSPAIDAYGTIYVGSHDNKLYAINPDGTLKWEFQTESAIPCSPTIGVDGTIYVGSQDRKLYAINPDGTKKWEFLTGGNVNNSLAISIDGTIYVGSNNLYAINPDGTKKWEFLTGNIPRSLAIGAYGTIYAGSRDRMLYAIIPDGVLKWPFETGNEIWSSPAIDIDGTIYIHSCDGNLYAINPDGTKKWEFPTGIFRIAEVPVSSPSIDIDGTIYVGAYDNNVYAINPDGTLKWEFLRESGFKCFFTSTPAIGVDGTIYVGVNACVGFYAINPDGTLKWEFLAGGINSSPAIGTDGTVYVGSNNTMLYAIYSDSYGLADSPWPMFQHDVWHTGRFGQIEKVIIPLTQGEVYEGTIWPWYFNCFSLEEEAGSSLLIEVMPQTGIDSLIFDGELGNLPLYAGTGYYTTKNKTPRSQYELLISPTEEGIYYFSLFGYEVDSSGGHYTINARYVDKYLSDISPRSAGNKGNVTISLKGLGFIEGMQVELSGAGLPVITPDEIIISSMTEAFAQFNLSGVTAGDYDVTVIWPDSSQDTLEDAFKITSSGIGPRLEAHLDPPVAVRTGSRYTVWLEYKNTGDADMPSPLFTVTGNYPISLNSEEIEGERVQILGIGNSVIPGILGIGDTRRIPIFFIAPSSGNPYFTLSMTQDSMQTIDWSSQKDLMKPPDMSEGEWDDLWPNLIARLGDTWTEYLEVLRNDAFRMKQRGIDEHDVRKLIRLEARQAAGEPVAAISGTLRDNDTRVPLKGVPIKVRSEDGSILRQTLTSYYPEGHFLLEDLPDATYEVLTEGYYFEEPVIITISNQDDVNGVVLFAKEVPTEEITEEELEIPGHKPAITKDDAGNIYLIYEYGNEIWWAINSGSGWESYGKIPDAEGSHPVIVYDPGLLDNGTTPGLFCTWESSTSIKTILWSAGSLTEDSITWTEPQALTSDSHDDYGIALIVDDNHNPLILWLQRDFTIEDDTDLYYHALNLANVYFNRVEQGGEGKEAMVYPLAAESCLEIPLTKEKLLPKWIPIIGGKYGFEVDGDICGDSDCDPFLSGNVDVDLSFGIYLTGSGHVGAEADWRTEKERCIYIFDEGSLTLGVGASAEIFCPPIPIVIFSVPIGNAKIGGHIEGNADGSLAWKSNFPAWPDEANILFDLGAGPVGKIELLGGGLGGKVTGTGSVEAEYKIPPRSFEFKGYCINLEGEVKAGWGWGALKKKWKKGWGPSCPQAKGIMMPLRVSSYRDSLLKSGCRLIFGDVPVYEELEYVKESLTGTGSVYEGNPILADISQDIYNDGLPAIAKSDSGEIIVVWTKDFYASDLGAKVYAATYDGYSWSSPVEITSDIDFNKDTVVVFDSDGNPMAVWSSASNEGLDYEQSSVEDILNAIDNADIMYARRVEGIWMAPETIATLAGRDEQVNISSGPSGEITAVWLNQSGSGSTIFASIWNGSSWSQPEAISTAVLAESPAVIYPSGNPMVVWAQDQDGNVDTFDDWKIYSSVWDGSSWSSPNSINPIEVNETSQRPPNAIHQNSALSAFGFQPPEECCEQEDKDPIPPDPSKPPKEDIEEATVPVIVPVDPNEKVATQGVGEQHYVNAGDRLRYTIYFENKSDATAPAQEVFITDYLDFHLDWTTLRMEEISFGDVVLSNPQNTPYFNDRVTIPDYREGEEKQWWVDINAEFNVTSRGVKTTLCTLDPETGELPDDPFAGFLPPEDGTGRGQGYITLSVCTKKDRETGTIIRNKASIVFDTEDPVVTNEVFHTIFILTDSDADGVLDDGDFSGTAGDKPCTGGETLGCDDNCPLTYNPDQSDADGDGIGDACEAITTSTSSSSSSTTTTAPITTTTTIPITTTTVLSTTTTIIPTPECEVTIDPSSKKVLPRATVQFNAITSCDGEVVTGDYTWYIDSTIGSSINEESGLYKAGTGAGTDTVRVIDTANWNTEATTEAIVSLLWPMAYDKMWGARKDEKLLLLRVFRDEILLNTEVGREYVSILYNNSFEIAILLLQEPSLTSQTREVIDELLQSVESLLYNNDMIISQKTIGNIESLLTNFETKASPKLKTAIMKVKEDIKKGEMFGRLGITINE